MFNSSTDSKRVISAMSGGVDSSVATLLLLESGYDVMGATMKLFDSDILEEGAESRCCSIDDVEDARAVCRRLGIRHVTLNFKGPFASDVIDRFCASYLRGDTPNPCIDCNRFLKFKGLQQRRRELGADYVATGHYVRRRWNKATGTWELLRAKDAAKDQSYVLYHLTQDDLEHMLFPLGDLTKDEVRTLAREHRFGNAEKKESQDICFVPNGDYVDFIARYQGARADLQGDEAGAIVDSSGKKLGDHTGLVGYTIGQRKGIGIASSKPLYVLDKDVGTRELIVGPYEELLVESIWVSDLNVISGNFVPRSFKGEVKTGYRQKPTPAQIEIFPNRQAQISFSDPIVKPAPGQSAVMYQGDTLIGGGTIVRGHTLD